MAHLSVLLHETIDYLLPPGKTVQWAIDGTCGAGGHAAALLTGGVGELLGLDLDAQALALAQTTLAPFGERAHLVQDSYLTMAQHAAALDWSGVDAIVLDLGLSSMQLDTPERGFAFRHEGALDMRFNPADDTRSTAADIVNTWDAADLAQIFFDYGEERFAKLLARTIVQQRPFETTSQLAEAIAAAAPKKRPQKGKPASSIHPATRIFQALRITVNDELGSVAAVLPIAIKLLNPGGRLAIITFHSLEDRIVKQAFKDASAEFIPPPGMASLGRRDASIDLITRKPVEPTPDEIAQNPRSRSAKLRVIQKR
jgi:16S rRNA (cytosine1402-N4)-methyltransferase